MQRESNCKAIAIKTATRSMNFWEDLRRAKFYAICNREHTIQVHVILLVMRVRRLFAFLKEAVVVVVSFLRGRGTCPCQPRCPLCRTEAANRATCRHHAACLLRCHEQFLQIFLSSITRPSDFLARITQ